jgi:hypothetical protein
MGSPEGRSATGRPEVGAGGRALEADILIEQDLESSRFYSMAEDDNQDENDVH